MLNLLYYPISFVSGVLVKWVDWIDDEQGGKHLIKYPLAIAYGLLIGYLVSVAPFSEIFIAALVAQVFARKVDTMAHDIGFISAAIAIAFFGVPQISLVLFFYFLVLAFLDEQEFVGSLGFISDYRPFLKLGSLLPLAFGRWEYAAGIWSFDIGYLLLQEIMKRTTKPEAKPKKAEARPKEKPAAKASASAKTRQAK
ncbi:Uncharacterised protein [uncultured archaeon]|nr:Uncharacterised protein [uncultured archaeon]